jgi:RNA polymerase sigma-70 factor (sigma-E family)
VISLLSADANAASHLRGLVACHGQRTEHGEASGQPESGRRLPQVRNLGASSCVLNGMKPTLRLTAERRQGDAEFADFVASAQRRLLHAGWLLTHDEHRAEELAQDALVRTYAAWHRVRRDDAFSYARRALLNANVDGWRRRRQEQLTDDVPELRLPTRFEDVVADRGHLVEALQRLTVRERRVVVSRYYLDLSEEAVAAELGISVGTVKSTTSRALAKLRVQPTAPLIPSATPQRGER